MRADPCVARSRCDRPSTSRRSLSRSPIVVTRRPYPVHSLPVAKSANSGRRVVAQVWRDVIFARARQSGTRFMSVRRDASVRMDARLGECAGMSLELGPLDSIAQAGLLASKPAGRLGECAKG